MLTNDTPTGRGRGRGQHRVCADCRRLTLNGTYCEACATTRQAVRNASRTHYRGDYGRRKRAMLEHATACWICGLPATADDPLTADHLVPGHLDSPLAPAHRSCNSRRGNKPISEVKR